MGAKLLKANTPHVNKKKTVLYKSRWSLVATLSYALINSRGTHRIIREETKLQLN